MGKAIGCSCQKIGKMRKNRKRSRVGGLNTKGAMAIVTEQIAPAAVGYVVGDVIINNIPVDFIKTNAKWVKLAGGTFLALTQKGFIAKAGMGMAVNGANEILSPLVSKMNGINLLPAGYPTYRIAGMSDNQNFVPSSAQEVKLKVG